MNHLRPPGTNNSDGLDFIDGEWRLFSLDSIKARILESYQYIIGIPYLKAMENCRWFVNNLSVIHSVYAIFTSLLGIF